MRNELTRKSDFSPFKMINEMEREMERFMDNLWRSPGVRLENNLLPSCEINEKKGHYMMSFDLPGIPKDEIKIDLSEGKLRIYGERKDEHHEGQYTERRYGKFERTISLPENVSTDDAEAVFENGVLTIAMRKTGDPKIKRLEIASRRSGGLWSRLLDGNEGDNSSQKIKSSKIA